MRIDPSDLATFLAIARHRSFRAAATELGVSPSALSHALRNIVEKFQLSAPLAKTIALHNAAVTSSAAIALTFSFGK